MSEPLILAFDTSAAHCAAALLSGDHIISTVHEDMKKGQAERLMVLLENLLSSSGKTYQDLDAIAVGIGPGNFTGIRLSVSAARGLALGLNIPSIGVSLLEALNYGQTGPCLTALPAPRDCVYLQGFETSEEIGAQHIALTDIPQKWSSPDLCIVGPAADAVSEKLNCKSATTLDVTPDAIARCAAMRLGQNVPKASPLYLRPADAAPPRDTAPKILP